MQETPQQPQPNLQQVQPQTRKKSFPVLPILVTFLISAIIFGGGGYYFGLSKNQQKLTDNSQVIQQVNSDEIVATPTASNQPTNTPDVITTKELPSNSNLVTYSNALYHYSISFPQAWKVNDQTFGPKAVTATPYNDIIEVSNTTQPASTPYPYGTIVIQHHSEIPGLYNSWSQRTVNINEIPVKVYENTSEQSVVWIFTAPEEASFIEFRFNSSSDDPSFVTVEEIASTFRFTY